MLTIKAQKKKFKTLDQAKEQKNWAIVEHPGDQKIKKGVYRICPCCFFPLRLTPDEIKVLMLDLLDDVEKEILKSHLEGK